MAIDPINYEQQYEQQIGKVMDVAHNRGWQTFEVVFGVPFLVAIALEFLVPLSLPEILLTPAVIIGGVILIMVGGVFIILAHRKFTEHGQPTDPGRPTSKLITTGVFSISRNPLYLGGVSIVIGIALVFNIAWVLVLLLASLVGCHYILIAPEEQYLAARFGAEYHTYAASVHRWIGRARDKGSE